jgi:Cu/Ag efflux pump CusA
MTDSPEPVELPVQKLIAGVRSEIAMTIFGEELPFFEQSLSLPDISRLPRDIEAL